MCSSDLKINFVGDAKPTIESELSAQRQTKYLEDNYLLVTKLDFDYDYQGGAYLKPLRWEESTYGFAYPVLNNARSKSGYHPNWSEYGLFTSMNVASENTSSGYGWSTRACVRDRKFYNSKKRDKGYFVYVDASEKPGTLVNLKFNEQLCSDTKLYISAWICNLNSNTGKTNPNVNFVLKGRTGDTEDVLHRFTTGDIEYKQLRDTVEWL